MSSFPIFKVNYLIDKNNINKILVFNGNTTITTDLNDLFYSDPSNVLFKNIFSINELQMIKEKNITVIFVNETIHIDDTIGSIKLKIVNAFEKIFSEEEVYLFCLKEESLNPITVYQNLTLNNKIPLTKIRLEQMLLNIRDEDGNVFNFQLPSKEKYTFDDILKLDLADHKFSVAKILGQKIVMENAEYPFIADPFFVNKYDILLERTRKELSTLNNSILLDTGSIIGNNIYLCLASNVFSYCDTNNISLEYTSKIYFPFLYKQDIQTLEALDLKKQAMINETNKKIDLSKRTFENIDLFYNIFKNKKPTDVFSINNKNTGIKNIKVVLHPPYKVRIPIDVIFKLIHANINVPLIKYNQSSRQENIYRVFTNKITNNGRKIPYLSKSIIFKLIKGIGKTKSVSAFVYVKYENTVYTLICEFEENGFISISSFGEFEKIISINNDNFLTINSIISSAVNPLIEQIQTFFEQSGYKINNFVSIDSANVEIQEIEYQTVYNISHPFNIEQMKGCVSSIFTIETNDISKGLELRFKRVSNFNKHDSQEAFVIEKQKQKISNEEIVEQLIANYEDMTEERAYEIIDKLLNELQVTRGANKRRAIEIKINPGFKTIIEINTIASELIITMNNINDLNYFDTIPVYLDSMVRISQDINSIEMDVQNIEKMCSGTVTEDVQFKDIISASEESFPENDTPKISDDNIEYTNEEDIHKMNELLDILGYSEESDEELSGGVGNNSSNSDLSSLSSIPSKNNNSSSSSSEISSEPSFSAVNVISTPPESSSSSSSPSSSSSEISSEQSPPLVNVIQNQPTSSSSSEISSEQSPPLVNVIQNQPTSSSSSSEISSEQSPPLVNVIQNQPTSSSSSSSSVSSSSSEISSRKSVSSDTNAPVNVVPINPDITIQDTKNQTIQSVANIPINKKLDKMKEQLKNTVKDIEGMRLHNPYIFQERLETRDPNLFLTLRQGKFDGYSRMCPSGVRRQPVILTKDELENIAKDNSTALMGNFKDGEYDGPDVLKYGSSPDNQFYYMCPRYWCLKSNTVVTEQQIRDGACGGTDAIIPKNAKTVPKGKYIYQFYDNNTTHYPGFHKENTPNGLCIPCCYESWNKPAQTKRRAICQSQVKTTTEQPMTTQIETTGEAIQNPEEILQPKEVDEYVKGPEKFPLDNQKWGYLPFAVQKFLHEMNVDCQESKTNTNIKPYHTCLLRHGVQSSSTQSFISCIANALFYTETISDNDSKPLLTKYFPETTLDVPTIEMMKQIIINAITIDTFITFQNGDLVTSFANDKLEVDETKYYGSKLYKKIQEIENNDYKTEKKLFFNKVVRSFENFILFLKNKEIVIDYTYLWDIICIPNQMLFTNGINLIIFEILNDDITNNIELICPTNHYSSHIYDPKKRNLILIKQRKKDDVYFEPVYSYRKEVHIKIKKTFSELEPSLSPSLRAVFRKIIKPTLKDKCTSLKSRSDYKFVEPPLLDNLILDLFKKGYQLETQVLNFQGKVIGVIVIDSNSNRGFIPCFPSSLTTIKNKKCVNPKSLNDCNYDYIYMTDVNWFPYRETLNFLKEYYQYSEPLDGSSGKCIDGTDLCKVIEENLVVGFLTKTNQFVQISPPVPAFEVEDNIRKVTNNNYLVADIKTQVNKDVDLQRVEYIKKIELETAFYNVFRTTIRILLNDYINTDKRKEIQTESNNRLLLYDIQLEKIIILLKELCEGYVIFANKEDSFDYNSIENIYACASLSIDKCNDKSNDKSKKSICMVTNDKCSIVLPKENLINKKDNEQYYYEKMADELIRYNRIKTFIFQPQMYLSFEPLKYNLREDEIIILQSLLNDEFFENLIPSDINKYAKNNTFDNTEPIITIPYTNIVTLDDAVNPNQVRDCFPTNPEKFTTAKWKKCFPKNYKEIEYKGSKYCAIYLFIDIIKQVYKKDISVNEVKDILFEEYKNITQNLKKPFVDKIADILIEQGKIDDGNQLKFGSLHILEMIMSEGYFFTNFDLWLLLNKYKIQSIFLSSYLIPESRYNDFHFTCYVDEIDETNNDIFVFIVVPAIRESKQDLIYKIVVNEKDSILIDINMLVGEECKGKLKTSIENAVTIEEYLDSFKRDIKTKYNQKKPGIRKKIIPEFELIEQLPVTSAPAPAENIEPAIDEVNILEKTEPVKRKRVKKVQPILMLTEEPIIPPQIETNEQSPVFHQAEQPEKSDQQEIQPKKNKKIRTKKVQVIKTGNKPVRKPRTKKNPQLILVTQDTNI